MAIRVTGQRHGGMTPKPVRYLLPGVYVQSSSCFSLEIPENQHLSMRNNFIQQFCKYFYFVILVYCRSQR